MEAIHDTYVLLLIILETKSYHDIKSRFSKSQFDLNGGADMFIGREAELSFFQDKYDENRGQFVVLYGRRRVGKIKTLREFCKGKPHIFYSCTQSTDKVQLAKIC